MLWAEELKYSVVGRISLRKGDEPPTTLDLINKLVEIWNTEKFKLVPMGKVIYHIILKNMKDQCEMLSTGAVNTRPNVLRSTRWVPDLIWQIIRLL